MFLMFPFQVFCVLVCVLSFSVVFLYFTSVQVQRPPHPRVFDCIVLCCVVLCCAVLCCVVLCCVVSCRVVLCCVVLCCVVLVCCVVL